MNEAVFKTTVMGGFNKGEVLAFVDKQDAQFKAREKELTAQIAEVKAQLKAETDHSAQLEATVKELETSLEEDKTRYAETLKHSQEVSMESGRIKSECGMELTRRDNEIDKLRQQVLLLNQSLEESITRANEATRHAEDSEQKLRLIDKTEEQIGRALLEAQQTADKILDEAKSDAAVLREQARLDACAVTQRAQNQVQTILADAKVKMDGMLSSVGDYKKCIEKTRGDVRSFFASVDGAFSAMQEAAGDAVQKFASAFEVEDIAPETETEKQAAAAAEPMKFDFSASKAKE